MNRKEWQQTQFRELFDLVRAVIQRIMFSNWRRPQGEDMQIWGDIWRGLDRGGVPVEVKDYYLEVLRVSFSAVWLGIGWYVLIPWESWVRVWSYPAPGRVVSGPNAGQHFELQINILSLDSFKGVAARPPNTYGIENSRIYLCNFCTVKSSIYYI